MKILSDAGSGKTAAETGTIGLLKDNRGIALLITLTVITVLVAASIELHKRKRTAIVASAAVRDRITLIPMAESGIHAAMGMLVRDRIDSETDTIQEDWANPTKIKAVLGDIPFEAGNLEVIISDERGRVQLNALVALPGNDFNPNQFHLWDRLLGYVKQSDETLSDVDPNAIINSLKDWIDDGDDEAITGLTGAESSYYESLEPPYTCRNAPLDHLGDLSRINGITAQLLRVGEGQVNILEYLTVHGAVPVDGGTYTYDGKININTAPLAVLAAILPEDYDGFAPTIVDYRIEKSGDQYVNSLTGLEWYKNVPGLEDLSIKSELITNVTDIFRISSTASLNGRDQTVEAIVQREKGKKTGKWRCRILRWQMN